MFPVFPHSADWPAEWAALRMVVNEQGLSGEVPFTHYMVTVYVGQFQIADLDISKDEVDRAVADGKSFEHVLFENLVDLQVLHVRFE